MRNEIVGKTNISISAIPSAWLRSNVLQPWDGGSRRLTRYLATLVCPISTPSLRSSPWILGAPHRGLAMLISRISLRISNGTVGLPPRAFDFQRQYNRKPARCHLNTVAQYSGRTVTLTLNGSTILGMVHSVKEGRSGGPQRWIVTIIPQVEKA